MDIGHYGDCLQCEMNMCFSYLLCLLLYEVTQNYNIKICSANYKVQRAIEV